MSSRRFNTLLRDVSRSFYLSMRFLPGKMREPVSLAYLLARASDTLADTTKAPIDLRKSTLDAFRESVLHSGDLPSLGDFARHQVHAGERTLLEQLPLCMEWLSRLEIPEQQAIQAVFDQITQGQQWDLLKAGEVYQKPVTVENLEQYTYWVAGSVGEFWTRIGYYSLGDEFADPSHHDDLMEAGVRYGKALQLLNILLDIGEDLEDDRCYLPVGKTIQQGLKDEPTLLVREMKLWQAQCRDWLEQSWGYIDLVRHPRVRFATVLPLIIGQKTLAKLEAAGEAAISSRVKIDRKEVRSILWKTWWRKRNGDRLREI